MCSEPGNERTCPLLEQFSFSSQEPVAAVSWITSTLKQEPFLSDTSVLRTDDLMILRMRVIFQAGEKHVIQVFC